MTEYDMLWVKQLLPDRDIEFLFYDATTEKRLSRELGTEKKRKKILMGVIVTLMVNGISINDMLESWS